MAKEMMMVPTSDYNNLVNYYKGRLTESTLLNKAGRLAAERHTILADPTIPNATALAMTKPKAKELNRLTKRIRTGSTTHGTTVTGGKDDEDDDDAMLVSPLEHKLDKILRATQKTLKQQPPTPVVPPTRRRQLPKTPKKQPVKTEEASTKSGWISSMKRGALKGVGNSLGVNVSPTSDTDSDDEGATRQKKKRNPPPKRSNGCVRHRDGKILRKANNSGELSCRTTRKRRRRTRTKNQAGGSLDVQKWLGKTGIEFHWPGYQYMGPGTHLKKRLARGDPGINRLDKIAKIHDIDYSRSKNLEDKWAADKKMVKAIDNLPGRNTPTEFIVKHIMKAKRRLHL